MRQLTNRQSQIVALLRLGFSQQEAARRLGLTYGTVRKQLVQARDRSGCRSTAELAAKAEWTAEKNEPH